MRRLVELRGLTPQEAAHRLSSQATDAQRLAVADVVIDSMGSLDDTLAQVDRLWDSQLQAHHRPAHSDSSVGGAP